MAEVNMAQALNSPSYAERCWRNFYLQKNSMNISPTEIGQIEAAWSDRLGDWKSRASVDDTKYEITDDDFNKVVNDAKNQAKKTVEADVNKAANVARASIDMVAGAGGIAAMAAAGTVGIKVGEEAAKAAAKKTVEKLAEKGAKKLITKGSKEIATKAAQEGVEKTAGTLAGEASKQTGKVVGFVISTTVGAATGIAYLAKRPNKDQKEACEQYVSDLSVAQGKTSDAQAQMEVMNAELVEAADEAAAINEDANAAIEDTKSKYDFYKTSYETLKAKADSGVAMTRDEKDLYKTTVKYMQEAGALIDKTSEDASEQVTTVYDNMAEYQEGFNGAAETVAEVQGLTESAEAAGKNQVVMCSVEAAAQGLNVVSSTYGSIEAGIFAASGSWAFGATAWAWAFVALGAAGATMSGTGVGEQIKWAVDAGKEVDFSKVTQDLNATTAEAYDAHIENYASYMEGVEGLELAIPDDVSAPEETEVPVTADASTTNVNERKKTNETA